MYIYYIKLIPINICTCIHTAFIIHIYVDSYTLFVIHCNTYLAGRGRRVSESDKENYTFCNKPTSLYFMCVYIRNYVYYVYTYMIHYIYEVLMSFIIFFYK